MRNLLLRSLFQKQSPDIIFIRCFLSQVAFGGVKGKVGRGEANRGYKVTQVWRNPGKTRELIIRQMEEGMCVTKVWFLKGRSVNAIVRHVPVCCLVPLSF